jgi:hypothetical protein
MRLRQLLFPVAISLLGCAADDGFRPRLAQGCRSEMVGPKGEKKTLEQFVDELITIGARLGALEDDKGRLQPGPGEPGPGLGAAILAARNQWVRLANALTANSEVAGLDAATDKLILGPLRAAEKAADRREASAPAKAKAVVAAEPETTGQGTGAPTAVGETLPKK